MGNVESSWEQTYESIKKTHDAAYSAIEAAISLEEQEKQYDAIEKYKEGIFLIDKALDTPVTCPENPGLTWEKTCTMIQKMKKTRAEVVMRINSITSSPSFNPEPQSQTASNENNTDSPRTYSDLAMALNDLPVENATRPAQLIYTHDNVQLYFISPDGSVSRTSEPNELNIFMLTANENEERRVFLQIEDWVYPLVPGVSPCYRTAYGAFILPDLESEIPGASIGIILPSDADASVYELLEDILHGIVGEKTTLPEIRARTRRSVIAPEPKSHTFSQWISNGLAAGGYYVSQGLIMGAQQAGSLINYGTPKIINYISPSREVQPISQSVVKGFEMASSATNTAAQVTGYVAEQVGQATQALGRFLAPHVQKQGTRLLTSGFNIPEDEASSKMNNVFTVAAGAVEGFTSVYRGLETSASILGSSLSNNTVTIVQHKYGETAGHIASNTLDTVGNVISIGHNTKFFTAKGIAKTTAKQAGKAMVEDYKSQNLLLNRGAGSTDLLNGATSTARL